LYQSFIYDIVDFTIVFSIYTTVNEGKFYVEVKY